MDSAPQYAFNLTRGVSLSRHVVSASDPLSPSQLLALVLNGPGRDSGSAVWLTHVSGVLEMPRLFAFDIICLDVNQQVIQVASVGPGTPFPALAEKVESVLFLPDQCLVNTGTVPGDALKISVGLEQPAHPKLSPQPAEPQWSLDEPPFALSVEPAQALEPFAGSLIFLPDAGLPQSSEMFLPARPMQSTGPPFANAEVDLPQAAAETTDALGSISAFSEPAPDQLEPYQSPELQHRSVAPPAAGLPRNLRAILQQVDEQIHRESIHAPDPAPSEESPTGTDIAITDPDVPPQFAPPENTQAFIQPIQPEIAEPSIALIRAEVPPSSIEETAFTPAHAQISRIEPPIPGPIEDQPPVEVPSPHRTPKLSFAARAQRWLAGESTSLSGNRRRSERVTIPGLVAFYWTGGAPQPHDIINISHSGLYLRTKELWSPNTLVRMSIERPSVKEGEKQTISVLARVVRADDGGVGHEFITSESIQRLRIPELLQEQGTDRKELERFLHIH